MTVRNKWKLEQSEWGAPLVERIQKPPCGCQRSFDPIGKKETVWCNLQFPLLIQLCRKTILKVMPLSAIEEAPNKLPLPSVLARETCKLHLNDFIIDPLKVRTKDLRKNLYNAVVSFSGQEVSLEVLNGGKKKENLPSYQNFITSFEDNGILCLVWDPVLSLEEIMRGHTCVGQQLSLQFVWRVVKSVSQHIMRNSHNYNWRLDSSTVKITKNKSTIYLDTDENDANSTNTFLTMNHSPEIIAKKPFTPEKAFVWCLGTLLYEMLTLTPFAYHPNARLHHPSNSFHLHRVSTGKIVDTLKQCSDPVLRKLAQDCLQDEALLRPSARDILKLAKQQCQQLNLYQLSASDLNKLTIKPNKVTKRTESKKRQPDSTSYQNKEGKL